MSQETSKQDGNSIGRGPCARLLRSRGFWPKKVSLKSIHGVEDSTNLILHVLVSYCNMSITNDYAMSTMPLQHHASVDDYEKLLVHPLETFCGLPVAPEKRMQSSTLERGFTIQMPWRRYLAAR